MSRPFTALGFAIAAWLFVGFLVWVAPAPAAFGDLTYRGCTGDAIVDAGCDEVPTAALIGATPLAISPDGRSLYTVAAGSATLTHLTRAAGGALSFESCRALVSNPGCVAEPDVLLNTPRAIALSADGRSMYLSSSGLDAVEFFQLAPATGRPAYEACLSSDAAVATCAPVPNGRLGGASGLIVDPRGGSVYVASQLAQAFVELDRDIPGGQISFAACFSEGGGCQSAAAGSLFGATATAVSPDGASIYIAGSEAINWFDHGGNGALRFRDCFTRTTGPFGCKPFTGSAPSHFSDMAVSADGRSLYVLSAEDNAILHFSRAADGSLTYRDCLASEVPGCVPIPGQPLQGPTSLAASADGRSVYVGSPDAASIAHFRQSSAGVLGYAGCISAKVLSPDDGCAVLPNGVLAGLSDIVISPDGTSLYATGQMSSTIVSFSRSLVEDPPPPDQPPLPPTPPSARCAGKRATIVGTQGDDTLRGTARRDVIAALGGNDTVRAGGGNDLVCGGPGKDLVVGASGRDEILGGPGADVLRGGFGSDLCLGGPGRNEVGCERGRGRRG